ncbi:MAG TPA: sigma-70 family RNA polymerase sigma factor [Verrucomicrobiales bacterium]|nr:sigma-70 family RNA polymerase sigma factor [Verrucomicrobiales bacterium]
MDSDLRPFTAALRRGDERVWRDFHNAFYPRVFRWLLALAHGDEEAAAEAAHLTFLRAVRSVPHTGDSDELWRWMTRLARCAYIDEWRKRKSRGILLRRWLDHSEPPGIPPADSDPLAVLDECLASLSSDDRDLLEEKYFARQPVRHLAADRQLSEKALESRLTRARERLRDALTQRLRHAD